MAKKKYVSARTMEYWLERGYSAEDAEIMRRSKTPGTIEYFTIFKGMSHNDAIEAKMKYHSSRVNTLENMIKKYGVSEGEVRWQSYLEKQAYSNSFEYKRNRYGWTREQYDEYNKSRGHPGESNPNHGTSYYERWVDTYGQTAADEMNNQLSKIKSNNALNYWSDNDDAKRAAADRYFDKCIEDGNFKQPMYSLDACNIIDDYGTKHGYNFQHAANGGEFRIPNRRYFVDGYDEERNVVIEYDERHHFDVNGNRIESDIVRQNDIISILGCTFIRIDYRGNVEIYEN